MGRESDVRPILDDSEQMGTTIRASSHASASLGEPRRELIGVIEIIVALLIALCPLSAKLSFIGSIGAIISFVLTVSFLFSTPGAFDLSHGFPLLGDGGQFLIKDLVLLGASIWTAEEARKEN